MERSGFEQTVCALFLALSLAACPSTAPPKKTGPQEAPVDLSKLPAGFKLDLPTAPISPKKREAPSQYPDGTWSITGLLAKKAAMLNKEVTVAGILLEVKLPEKKCDPCTPAHLYLGDSQNPGDQSQRLLVADFDAEQVEELEAGKRYKVSGTYVTTSSSAFSRTEGLISFKGVRE